MDKEGFDEWAGKYDQSIHPDDSGYPFVGYYRVLQFVKDMIVMEKRRRLLDIGMGTGLLTEELYKRGGEIIGIDFSPKMIALAREKMPGASFFCHDFSLGLPKRIEEERFDYILSSYAMHHLDSEAQKSFIKRLYNKNLAQNGRIILADIAFRTYDDLLNCKKKAGPAWDHEEEESYMVASKMLDYLKDLKAKTIYTQVSPLHVEGFFLFHNSLSISRCYEKRVS